MASTEYEINKPEQRSGEDWWYYANCRDVDPELFYPHRGASTRAAKEVCRACCVRDECLEYAIANGERFGIWGGLSERERRTVRRERGMIEKTNTDLNEDED